MSTTLKAGTSNACNRYVLSQSCEVNEVLSNIATRWKMQILHSISTGQKQFSLLKQAFPSLSDQILGKRLAELTANELIDKTIVKEKAPQQVVYDLTEKGVELLKIIDDLHKWGLKY